MIAAVQGAGHLLLQQPYNHKYPYDWRTKKPTIFRATWQWFISLGKIKEEMDAAVEGVTWMPASGARKMYTQVANRPEWCISRQRSWGVPIPAFFYKDKGGWCAGAWGQREGVLMGLTLVAVQLHCSLTLACG